MSNFRDSLRESELFLGNIGRCITNWANVEEKLFELCVFVLKAPRKQTAIVYYRTPTIDGRLSLVEELVAALLPSKEPGQHSPQIEIDWKKITAKFRKLLPERNALAHFPMRVSIGLGEYKGTDDLESVKLVRKLAMKPHRNELLRKEPAIKQMDAEMLPIHFASVGELELELIDFKSDLRKALS